VKVQAVEVFDPSAGAAHLARFATAPERLEEGAQVTLVTDQAGKVLYYKRVAQPSPEIATLRTDIDQVKTQVTTLSDTQPEITALRARVDANTAAVTATQVALQENLQLKQEVASLRADLATARQQQQQQIAVHEAAITELRTQNKELQTNTADTVRKLQEQVAKLRPNQ
jgi:chromosome segregation ATPase